MGERRRLLDVIGDTSQLTVFCTPTETSQGVAPSRSTLHLGCLPERTVSLKHETIEWGSVVSDERVTSRG